MDAARFGDATDTSCCPCPDNSGESITGNMATRAFDLTGCSCNSDTVDQGDDNSEPTQAIADPDDIACQYFARKTARETTWDNHASAAKAGGEIVWNAELNRYDGTCDATYCDVALESNSDDADTFYALRATTVAIESCSAAIVRSPVMRALQPEGDGVRSCLEGRLLEQEACVPLSCNSQAVIENAVHSCATIEHGTTCVASCATSTWRRGLILHPRSPHLVRAR